jgi:NitT/TauT family transport system substrate-binding protein
MKRHTGAFLAGAMALLAAVSGFGQAGSAAPRSGLPGELRVGLMPAYNSIPLVVAEAAGLFRANGASVTLVPFSGQLERETALQAGALDGTVSDLINAIQSWRHGSGARVTSVTEGNFSLLASPGSRLSSLRDWPKGAAARVKTGLLENSIVYYLTERMLAAGGADAAQVDLVPIVQLPARLEMLLAGKVDAACLPEPLATLAVSRGARTLADSDAMGTTPGVLLFTKKALLEKREQIQAFYRAYDAAVDEVNARPAAYRDAIVAGCAFHPAVAGLMRPPRFRQHFLPPAALVTDVGAWMIEKGLVDRAPAYAQIVVADLGSGDARTD